MTWFDSHAHLHLCEGEPGGLIERARAAGVTAILTAGIDVGSSDLSADLAGDGVYAAVGVHPNSADGFDDDTTPRLEELLARPGVVAVGETGLDFYRDRIDPQRQREVFAAQIALASSHDKALIIHTRASASAALDVLDAEGVPERVVFHCWSGASDELRRALSIGAFISFAGNVSFKGADELRAAVRVVPEDRLLVETDSPFLAPEPRRGRPNEPAHVGLVGAAVAAARGEAVEGVAACTTANARAVFGLDR